MNSERDLTGRHASGTTEIVVQLSPEAAAAFLGAGATSGETAALDTMLVDLGVELTPTVPGVDPLVLELGTFFSGIVTVAEAEEKLEAIRAVPGVRAAYVKPPGELPA